MVTASLYNYRQAPRKVRLLANLIKGKKVDQAIAVLMFTPKDAATPMLKLLKSAVANAKNLSISTEGMIVKDVTVNKGVIMKRMMPRARGRGFPIHKHTSHVVLTLDMGKVKKAKPVAAKKANTIKK
jgi:large subunit ribosomal protein L22